MSTEGFCFGSHPGFWNPDIRVSESFQHLKYRIPDPFCDCDLKFGFRGIVFPVVEHRNAQFCSLQRFLWFEGCLLRALSSIGVSLRSRGFRRYLILAEESRRFAQFAGSYCIMIRYLFRGIFDWKMGTQGRKSVVSDSMQCVKVYRLNDEGKWDDRGIGHVTVDYLKAVYLQIKQELKRDLDAKTINHTHIGARKKYIEKLGCQEKTLYLDV